MQRLLLIGKNDWFEAQTSLTRAGYSVRLVSPEDRQLSEAFEAFATLSVFCAAARAKVATVELAGSAKQALENLHTSAIKR